MKLDESLYAAVYKDTGEIVSYEEGEAIGSMEETDIVVDIVVNTFKRAKRNEIEIIPVKIVKRE